MVNSPSTSATDRNEAESRTPCRMFGTITRAITVNQPAPSDRAASARVVDVDGGQPGVERPVGVGQHQHDVDERRA